MTENARWNPTPPGWIPTPKLTPVPRVLLFEFDRAGNHYRCDLLDHGVFGTEAQFSKDGELLEGRAFESSTVAAMWADARREVIEKGAA